MKQRIGAAPRGVFPGCIGFVDGTFITLQYSPLEDWYFYFNRKSSYALNAMVVCTDQRRIIYMRVGDTSAVHDARVFEKSRLSAHPEAYFGPGEYLIGDSAYPANDYMITPYKKPRSAEPACRQFNPTLSSRRIAIEHLFGLIKARFPSVTAVGTRIVDGASHRRVVNWFEAACIIHNFLLTEDELEWDEFEDLDMVGAHQQEGEEEQEAEGADCGQGRGKKDQLRESLLEWMIKHHCN
jgi:hypothetical protein